MKTECIICIIMLTLVYSAWMGLEADPKNWLKSSLSHVNAGENKLLPEKTKIGY